MRLIILFFFVSVTSYAQPEVSLDTKRQVEGSYIKHTGKATYKDATLAAFMAQQAAISAIRMECGGRYMNSIMIDKTGSSVDDGKTSAYATAVIAFSECEAGKSAPKEDTSLDNAAVKKGQDGYDLMLKMGEIAADDFMKTPNIRSQMFLLTNDIQNELLLAKDERQRWEREQEKKLAAHMAEVYNEQDATQQQIDVINQREEHKKAMAAYRRLASKQSPEQTECYKKASKAGDVDAVSMANAECARIK